MKEYGVNPTRGPSIDQQADEQPALLVLYRKTPDETLWRQLGKGRWVILSFEDDQGEQEFLNECRRRQVHIVETLRASDYIDQASAIARDKFARFVAEWPDSYKRNGRNFKQMFTYRGEISYWWLSDASFKDNERSRAFEYFCHLEVLAQAMKRFEVRGCLLFTEDAQMATLTSRYCARLSIPCWEAGRSKPPRDLSPLRGLAGRVKSIFSLFLSLMFGYFVLPRPTRTSDRTRIAFFTIYPDCLRFTGSGATEVNYRDLADTVSSRPGTGVTYLAMHHSSTVRSWFRLITIRWWLSRRRNHAVIFLSSYLRPSDLGVAVWNMLFYARYLWIDRTDRSFRDSFVYDGINVYELMGREFRQWFLSSQIPFYLVMARAMERAVRKGGFHRLICFLELYPLARALYYGAKRGDPSISTVAYQHANINRMKLWYTYRPEELVPSNIHQGTFVETMPIPDRYLFQGLNGMEVLIECGYPKDRCILTGSPRYETLSGPAPASDSRTEEPNISKGDSGAVQVLVVPSLSRHDARELIDTVADACRDASKYTVRVKPHPLCPVDQYVSEARARRREMDLQTTQGDLHELIRRSDIVVTSYSTAGDEAIALGRPVVCYAGLRPCGATFLDIEAAPVVHSARELECALHSMLYDEPYRRKYQARWAELIEGSFYRLDGRAKERIVEALLPQGVGAPHDGVP